MQLSFKESKENKTILDLECSFKCFNTLHGGAQALLELGQFTAQVGVVAHQLLVHLRQLLQVVLQERNLLLLCEGATFLLGPFLGVRRFLYSSLQDNM